MSRYILLASLFTALVGGCTPREIEVPVEVKIPVAISCVPKSFPGPPVYADSNRALLGADGFDERYRLLIIGREQRLSRSELVEGVIRACREI